MESFVTTFRSPRSTWRPRTGCRGCRRSRRTSRSEILTWGVTQLLSMLEAWFMLINPIFWCMGIYLGTFSEASDRFECQELGGVAIIGPGVLQVWIMWQGLFSEGELENAHDETPWPRTEWLGRDIWWTNYRGNCFSQWWPLDSKKRFGIFIQTFQWNYSFGLGHIYTSKYLRMLWYRQVRNAKSNTTPVFW